jgi:hypothetical protein
MNTTLKLQTNELVHWFNALRNLPDWSRTRALEAFWCGQIDSKCWLVNTLYKFVTAESNIYVFGGWIGILANLLLQSSTFPIHKIRSIDIDPWCENIADTVNKIHEMNDWRFKARTCDMQLYDYEWNIQPDIVINTSTEHITQDVYDVWYSRIPNGTLVVAQGNDFFKCSEHIRCSVDLEEFCRQNRVIDPLFVGQLPHDLYTRWMCIWRKR